jgi:murein DD-endopeptidase MepM/ murein hydrolase activator NlpD
VAADSGTVAVATYSSSYGNYVMINHANGYTTLYAHMSSLAVSSGQTVSKGSTIGYVGSTGWSTGPHCHFEIRYNGATIDPAQFFSGLSYSSDS